jgi:hypothetical protein
VVHLKRFSFKNLLWREKLGFFVSFPHESLDLGPFVPTADAADAVYDLCGVSNHHGSIWGGHYTAYARSADDGQWRKFDDEAVTPATVATVMASKDAYVLFYRRRSFRAPETTRAPAAAAAAAEPTPAASTAAAAAPVPAASAPTAENAASTPENVVSAAAAAAPFQAARPAAALEDLEALHADSLD